MDWSATLKPSRTCTHMSCRQVTRNVTRHAQESFTSSFCVVRVLRHTGGGAKAQAHYSKLCVQFGNLGPSYRAGTEREPPTLRAALLFSTRPAWAPPRWLLACPATFVTRQVQKVARDAETLRRACEARRESSGCETFEWFPRNPEFSDGSQDADYRQLPAFGLYMSLRHLVSLSGWRLPASTRVRTTALHECQK